MAGYTDVCFAGRLLVGCIAFAALGFVTANARSDEVGQLTRQIEAFKTAGKYDDAIIAAERRAKLVEKRSGSSSAQTASALQEWSDLLAGENRHTEALPIVRRVLAIREQALGNHRDTSYTLNQLAWSLEALDAYADAERHLRRALHIREQVLGEDHSHTAFSVQRLGQNLYEQSRYAEAEPVLRRAVEMRTRILGGEHKDTAESVQWLADALEMLQRHEDAILTYRKALEIRELALGPEHPATALTLHNLGYAYSQYNKVPEAIYYLQRAAAIREKVLGIDHAATALTFQQLAAALFMAGQFDAGTAAAERALAIRQKILPPDHLDIATSLSALATFYQFKGRFAQADDLLQRALAIQQKQMDTDDPRLAIPLELLGYLNELQARYTRALELYLRALNIQERRFGSEDLTALRCLENSARIQQLLGRYAEAETSYRRVVALRDKVFGAEHVNTTSALLGIADEYARQGRFREAELLTRRNLEILERAYGPDHFLVAILLSRLGRQLRQLGRYADAEASFRRGLEINVKAHGEAHFFTAVAMEDLGDVLDVQGRTAEAEAVFRRAVEIHETTLGANHPNLAGSIGWLASVSWKLGRAEEAEALHARALSIARDAHGPDHDDTASSYASLAWVQLARSKWVEALSNYSYASDIYIRRSLINLPSLTHLSQRSNEGEVGRNSWTFLNHIRAYYWARINQPQLFRTEDNAAVSGKTFELAQWARLSDTSAALSQMSLRMSAGNDALAVLVREYQDLTGEWRTIDTQRIELLSKTPDNKQGPSADVVKKRLAEIEARLLNISHEMKEKFPAYAALSSPQAVPAKELQQSLLGPDEALVQYSLTPLDSFVWVVTREDIQWLRLSTDERKLIEMVAALRHQLSTARFNLNLAYSLYDAILAPIEAQVRGKHLLIVPSGALTSLPLHLLVTERPEAADDTAWGRYRKASWLIKRHPITVLPSVSALKALRQGVKRSVATQPFLGLGNPLLTGPKGDDMRAWNVSGCLPAVPPRITERAEPHAITMADVSAPTMPGVSQGFRGGITNVAQVRELEPLPETVTELCAVAASLDSGKDAVLLGAAATETAVKELNRQGRLAATRIIHFATHGLVAEDIEGLAEPALVLTPPAEGSDEKIRSEDDGLLTASEIAQLKLDADWIVLSACNTASGGGRGAEALSGLARAFFYAGARAVLVSHWEVNSQAAVKLTIGTFNAIAHDPTIGRAEALRRAMLALIENGAPQEAHPAYWAPFVVVGEGSAPL